MKSCVNIVSYCRTIVETRHREAATSTRPTWSMSRPCWGLKSVQCCEGAVPRFSAELDPYPCGTLPADAYSSTKPQKTANSEWRIIFVAVHFRHLLLFNLHSFFYDTLIRCLFLRERSQSDHGEGLETVNHFARCYFPT